MEAVLIANCLVEARVQAGLSQLAVARRMGTSQTAIARAESGRVVPSWAWLDRYAHAIGQPIVLWVSFGPQRLTPATLTAIHADPELAVQRRLDRKRQIRRRVQKLMRSTIG